MLAVPKVLTGWDYFHYGIGSILFIMGLGSVREWDEP